MATVDWVRAAVRGELTKPFWLDREATVDDDMTPRYREVVSFLNETQDRLEVRLKGGVEMCRDCMEIQVRAVETRSTVAFRVDACCVICGGTESHRAGWLETEVRDMYRKRIGSLLIG